MRRRFLYLAAALMCVTGCAKNESGTETTTVAAETSTTAEEPTTAETKETVTETTAEAEPETVWETTAPAVIREGLSEADMLEEEMKYLEKGTLLFEGAENAGYYGGDNSWLKTASENDLLAIAYSCDDTSHAGWGVLGLNVNGKQKDIVAAADQPDKVRVITFTMSEVCELAKVETISELEEVNLGAWNGGHIHGFYYVGGDTAADFTQFLADAEEANKIKHTYDGKLSNENAIDSAVIVYDYLKEVFDAQASCLTGQMESTWMGSADYEMNYIYDVSGKYPAIRGLDFMHNDFDGVARRAEEWWNKGGIPTICWHTGPDFASGYNESKDNDLKWDDAFVVGSDTYNKLLTDMDRAVPYLQKLEDAGVPVLWRPFHELDGGWFWWTRGGSENFVKLWQLMYSRYTDYWGLDNLIWVFGYSHNGGDLGAWYPGDDYVDLIGGDSYDKGANDDLYRDVEGVAAEGMPIVFHECGTIPTEEQLDKTNTRWLFFMVWHTDYITKENNNTKDSINEIYNSDYFITLDELPSFK